MKRFLFKDRDGQTPLAPEQQKGLKLAHIQTMGELDEYEEQNIAEGLAWLEGCDDEALQYAFWLKLHKKLFCDVWDWAGAVRKHELQNPDFLAAHLIWPAFKQLEHDARYWLENKSFSENEIVARFHERIQTIHPFSNGNGRFGRILAEYFCKKNGIQIPTWGESLESDPKERRRVYISALVCGRKQGDYRLLVEFMFS